MKIESHRPTTETEASQRVDASAKRNVRTEAQSLKGDRVEVSEGAKKVQEMVAEAVKSAATSPEIRQDKVDRARELLASGRLGQDSDALAAAIIDDLLERP